MFGLAGGLGFFYVESTELNPPLYLVGRTADLERDIAPHLGIELTMRDTADPDEGWAFLRDELDAGRPTMVWADIRHLDYLNVRMHNSRHDVVIVGYDESAGVAFVADNDRDEIQACDLASIARARNSDAFPGANRHTTFLYRWPERLKDPRAATSAALRRAIDHMRGGGEQIAGLRGGFGLGGVDTFAGAYPDWPRIFGSELPAALAGLRVFIVKTGTGGAMFRSLHARFLHDLGDLLGEPEMLAVAGTYDELAAAWVELAGHAEAHDHGSGVPVAGEIARLEHAGVEAMARVLERCF